MNSNESSNNDPFFFIVIVGAIGLVAHKYYSENKIEIHFAFFSSM